MRSQFALWEKSQELGRSIAILISRERDDPA